MEAGEHGSAVLALASSVAESHQCIYAILLLGASFLLCILLPFIAFSHKICMQFKICSDVVQSHYSINFLLLWAQSPSRNSFSYIMTPNKSNCNFSYSSR